jgi:hypothetical protein
LSYSGTQTDAQFTNRFPARQIHFSNLNPISRFNTVKKELNRLANDAKTVAKGEEEQKWENWPDNREEMATLHQLQF